MCFSDEANGNSVLNCSIHCSSIRSGFAALSILRTNCLKSFCLGGLALGLPTARAGTLDSKRADCSGWVSKAWSNSRLRITPRNDPFSPCCLAKFAHPSWSFSVLEESFYEPPQGVALDYIQRTPCQVGRHEIAILSFPFVFHRYDKAFCAVCLDHQAGAAHPHC